ncbi:MAG: hypothetical protein HOC71_16955 [Candidatus Latescibacteria bacterium]|jgi:plasmid maintenance system antidote protein VapI|nr:hypothetical protein [Desulfobacteraceae bacterium]MBT4485357.1 hypothetical protein [Candidatus Latescibacterota bacterium]
MNTVLKARIIEKFRTQIDFSKVIGVNELTVSRVINNRKKLSKPEQLRWAKALGCAPGKVFLRGQKCLG